MKKSNPYISIVIPVFNEEETLLALYNRLNKVLMTLCDNFEIIFVDDGSMDSSIDILTELYRIDSHVKIIQFNRNYGQHSAIFAGFHMSKGDIVVTMDADLQDLPEEIPKLIEKIKEGYDVAGGWRENRQHSPLRRIPSYIMNRITSKVIGVKLKDYGCMLRAYRREIVDNICQCSEISSYIPALANIFAKSVAEIKVEHMPRERGRSKYNIIRLLRLNFDLMTGFSLIPIQAVSIGGIIVALIGTAFGIFLMIRRFIVGAEVEGVFTLFAILFVFIGFQIFALGLMGEYIGRIYQEVRRRPRYIIKKKYE